MSVILCTAGYDHTIRFWEALSGICSRTIQHPESQVNRLCITPDKKYLAAAGRHVVRLYDIKSSNPNAIMTFEGHSGNITGVAFHCEGKWMVTSSEDGTVKVWDTRSGTEQRNYKHSSPVNDVVIHPNQGELVTASRDGSVQVWDLGESVRTHSMTVLADVSMSCVSVGSDGTILAAGNNRGDVYMWRIIQENGQTVLFPCRNFKAHKEYITRVLVSPDSKLLATCSADHTVRIWRMDPNETYLEEYANDPLAPAGRPRTPSAASQSQSEDSANEDSPGSVSMSSSRSEQRAIEANPVGGRKGGEVECILRRRPLPSDTVLENHQRWVWDCAFSADSAYLVTVCSDHYARLWELATASIIRQYNGHHRGAVCVALNDYSEPR